ncbi:MAG: hypothetical protein ACYTHM_23385 [Planctomycetota bacterium]|jgi:hypothetical protein
MQTFQYDLETLPLPDLLPKGSPERPGGARVFACDHAGQCQIEDLVDEIRKALVARLNERGHDGWRLAHMELHAEVVFLVWEKPGPSA